MQESIDFIRNLTESDMGISLIDIIFDKGPAIMSCPGALIGYRRPCFSSSSFNIKDNTKESKIGAAFVILRTT